MEVVTWKKSKQMLHESGFMVRVTRDEAVMIISSLAEQIERNNNNRGRKEFTTGKGEYFSISVQPINT